MSNIISKSIYNVNYAVRTSEGISSDDLALEERYV
jgi:hypothetical protein